jgi:hypothetical protein
MQLIKPFFAGTLVFVFSIYVFAQNTEYPNELEGYQFFGSGKLKSLQLLVSSKEDAKRSFGGTCEKQCDYDTDWSIRFEYFDDIWIKESSNDKGDKLRYLLDSKYLGKLRTIEIKPKNRVSFLNISFPDSFKRVIVTSTTDARGGRSRMTVNDAFQDANGLTYEIYSRTNYDDIKQTRYTIKGDLFLIRYNITMEMEKGLFVLQN